jgi:arylsulfatase
MIEPHLRAALPIADIPQPGLTTYDAKDPATSFPPIEPLRPPEGAPNVLIVLLDDVGFGASSAFGGPCHTPNAERLAAGGLKFNRFHTTALCAPTRQALLTGRNHHSVGMGSVTETATSSPGNSSIRPNTKAPLAETLRLNGYSTAQFGKCHEVPVWQTSPMGPFDAWPTSSGFEHFYGFIGGENNQWDPALYAGTTPIEPPTTPEEGYHLTEDLADRAIDWMRQQKALMPDKPFFVYFAPGATHAPHHCPPEWIEKYRGRFSQGWDALREEIFARQKELGVVPADAELTDRMDAITAWDDMPEEMKPILERQMETYAGFLEHTDHHVGRVLDAVEQLGVADDTLIYYIIGDNGASAEGTMNGAFNEMANFNGMAAIETPEFMAAKLDDFGSPAAYNHYSVGWAHAMCTPFQWTKQVASHWGGTRNGTIVHWPNGIEEQGGLREQFTHCIDVAPTILEAAGLPHPVSVNGVQQAPIEGTSMLYAFNAADEPERHDLQYFEMFGNRGVYHRGWSAVTKHRTPWLLTEEAPPYDDDVWELYDGSADFTQANNLAAEHPDRLAELQRLWLIEAVKHQVLPMDDRTGERLNPDIAGRPTLIRGTSQLFYSGMGRLSENSVVSIKNKSFSVTAEVTTDDRGPAAGVLITQGGRFGGWAVHVVEGRLTFTYNVLGIQWFDITADAPIPAGTRQVRAEFAYDGGGLAKGGTVTLFHDGAEVGSGRVEITQPMVFSADETTDVGVSTGTPVSPAFTNATSRFTGTINWVLLDTGDDDHDHLVRPEDRMRVVLGQQ